LNKRTNVIPTGVPAKAGTKWRNLAAIVELISHVARCLDYARHDNEKILSLTPLFLPSQGLLNKRCDFSGIHDSVVDADVVDQAGEEGAGFHGLAGSEVESI
jgi:hypothetical protein